jgi:hypothetical protein
MADVVGLRAHKIGPSEVVKILLGHQYRHATVVDVEKILQVAKLIRAADGFNRIVGQLHVVALGQRKHQFRLEAAFDVNVQLAFGQPFDELFGIVHPSSFRHCQSFRSCVDRQRFQSICRTTRKRALPLIMWS